MHYIVFDLEFNQDVASLEETDDTKPKCPFEIIQIGAVKLDSKFQTVSSFHQFVKPSIYANISTFVTILTGITTKQLQEEPSFPDVYKEFIEFIDDPESIFCIWGTSDIKELYRNVNYYQLDKNPLPKLFINIQPLTSLHLGISSKKLLRLQTAVEALNIPVTRDFHHAYNDAYYTAEIFKKVYTPAILPSVYNPNYVKSTTRQPKKVIDFDALIQQFEKMYHRDITKEEQELIKLAYKMGKTGQFIK
ncbi:MAG: polymerase [Lachnospiraceae bacterium]|jgi:DNA polymerase III epsilon subunit-like protein|nr:polymerase [Lachnospiraceae bacterium]